MELSSRRSVRRLPRQITSPWIAPSISTTKEFSTLSQGNVPPRHGSMGKQPESKSSFSKLLLGTAVFAGAFLVAYQTGYMDQYLGKRQHKSVDSGKIVDDAKDTEDGHHLSEQIVSPKFGDPGVSSPSIEHKIDAETDPPHSEVLSETSSEKQHLLEDNLDVKSKESILSSTPSDVESQERTASVEEKNLEQYSDSLASDNQTSDYETSSIRIPEGESLMSESTVEASEEVAINSKSIAVPEEKEMKSTPSPHPTTEETQKEVSQGTERPAPLLDEYHLRENADKMAFLSSEHLSKEEQALDSTSEELNDSQLLKDGKLILDFLQAIHAAEQRQAELDAHVFSEEKRVLKEKYENELRDLRARELMRIEEAAILDKELKRERTKAAIAIKSVQEKMKEKLRMELEQKEMESEQKLKRVQELAEAELAAAIVNEKAAQIEKMAEANLHINALCMAFYARSEEARKSHFIHKLSSGALALEDALSKGLPIQKEIDALQTYLEGVQKDSILDVVLSSLPEETRNYGTDTLLQLSQKFNTLKGALRHFSLIPRGGGGILAHSLAHIATWLKVREVDEGIEYVINCVESYLADGNLVEAAAALEDGVKGSQAEDVVGDWVRQARNRAITEQALTLLQSYATCISLT